MLVDDLVYLLPDLITSKRAKYFFYHYVLRVFISRV